MVATVRVPLAFCVLHCFASAYAICIYVYHRTNRFYLPLTCPGATANAHEIGQEKRTAQLLGGLDVPLVMLESLLMNKNKVPLTQSKDTGDVGCKRPIKGMCILKSSIHVSGVDLIPPKRIDMVSSGALPAPVS